MNDNITDEQRKQALAAAVSRRVQEGWRVEATSDYQAVLVKGRRPNNTFHMWMSVFTFTLWFWFVWLWLLIFARERRATLTVDPYGNVVGA